MGSRSLRSSTFATAFRFQSSTRIATSWAAQSRRSLSDFASLDLQVLKRISAQDGSEKYRFRVGLKVFNLTNHFNPREYQGNLASDEFGGFYNGVGRLE